MPHSTKQVGFSLTEVIVAFAILALSVSVLLQSFSLGQRKVTRSENMLNASFLAKSKMEEVGQLISLKRQEVVGVEESKGLGWRIVIDPFDPVSMKPLAPADDSASHKGNLYNVYISVHEENSGQLLLEVNTVKISKEHS